MIQLTDEPLWPSLVEIAMRPEARNAILAGGLGLRLKRALLIAKGSTTLFDEVPELRATSDLDFLLSLNLWMKADPSTGELTAKAFRNMLLDLGYVDALQSWQFKKPMPGRENWAVKVDLQARLPVDGERDKVKVKAGQVGRKMKVNLSGLATPEAFAVDDLPIEVALSAGGESASILVPHPYAWLNLKSAAAFDWLNEIRGLIAPKKPLENGDSRRLKHVSDVYAVVGMMTEDELLQAQRLALNYAGHEKAIQIRNAAQELYGKIDSPGSTAIRAHQGGEWAEHFVENYEAFWDALRRVLAIP